MRIPQLPDGVRPARPDDVATVLRMVVDLARYERAEEEVVATEAGLHDALFGPGAVAFALVAESGGEPVGIAVAYRTFSTWVGRPGVHLEDLFVAPDARGTGRGEALLSALARITEANDWGRLEWDCLDWNAPSIGFYEALGAERVAGWISYRVTGSTLHDLATRVD
ncbi:GNAT family N-acetyltransferase [Aeromicrobium halocynthiae]|uniref:GNAT family N-acetyltransferase n=1 Tax=Aeromicrobium halocynthiae TaxID=560557 RepID=A0ABN2VX89_9ACTN